ncbi:hypothetical protein MRX96_044487 [Rhipicephalus microplus]
MGQRDMQSMSFLTGVAFIFSWLQASYLCCFAYGCHEPPGGCPLPTPEKTMRLFFFEPVWQGCVDIETSGCGAYGWPTLYHCKFFCKHMLHDSVNGS